MLPDILNIQRKVFDILAIYQEQFLDDCLRTSFTWSKLPNTLCLAMNKKYFKEAALNENIRGIIAPPGAILSDYK